MRYYINGKQATSTQAREAIRSNYYGQGGCLDEFEAVWEGRDCEFSGEEKRELLNEWSGYIVEVFTDEEEENLDD